MFIDLGSALNAGVQGYRQAQADTQNELLNQEKLRQLQQQLKIQQEQWNQQKRLGEKQISQADLQLQQIKDQLIQQKVWRALDAYRQSNGNNKYLNLALKDPEVRKLFGGVVRIENISKDDYKALQKQGIDPELIASNPFRFVKAIDENGNVNYVDMNAVYGWTGYHNYAIDNQLKELKAKMALLPYQKYQEQEQAKQDWINLYTKAKKLGGFDKLSPQEQARYKMLQKQFSFAPTNLDKATDAVTDGTDVSITLSEAFKEPKTLNKLINNKNFIVNARKYQILTGKHMLADQRKNYLMNLNMLKEAHKVLSELSKLKEEDVAKGPLDEGLQKLRQYFTEDKLKDMSPQERLKFIKSIEVNTKVGLLLKQYLLAMSGQGVTDEEYQRVKQIIEGGNYSNLPALKTALSSFYDYKVNGLKANLSADAMAYPADVIDLVRPYKNYLFTNFKVNPNTMNIQTSQPTQQKGKNIDKWIQMLNNVKVD